MPRGFPRDVLSQYLSPEIFVARRSPCSAKIDLTLRQRVQLLVGGLFFIVRYGSLIERLFLQAAKTRGYGTGNIPDRQITKYGTRRTRFASRATGHMYGV
jgi:hypothetical protein